MFFPQRARAGKLQERVAWAQGTLVARATKVAELVTAPRIFQSSP